MVTGTELGDVKRLLRGNQSTSTSPTRSPNNTLPIPTKASVETRTMSESSSTGPANQLSCLLSLLKCIHGFLYIPEMSGCLQVMFCIPRSLSLLTFHLSVYICLSSLLDHYGSIWSGGVSSSYGYNSNHNNLSSPSTLYPSGQ